jgi:hypothetical protein
VSDTQSSDFPHGEISERQTRSRVGLDDEPVRDVGNERHVGVDLLPKVELGGRFTEVVRSAVASDDLVFGRVEFVDVVNLEGTVGLL